MPAQRRNGATAQRRNGATAQRRNGATAQRRNSAGMLFPAHDLPKARALCPEASVVRSGHSGEFPDLRGAFPNACGTLPSHRVACLDRCGKRLGCRSKRLKRCDKHCRRRGNRLDPCGKRLKRSGKLPNGSGRHPQGRANGKTLKNRPKNRKISRKGAAAQGFRDFNPGFAWRLCVCA